VKRSIVPLGVVILLLIGRSPTFAADPPFELVDGDRVVLIGGTMIERDQSFGYLETRLTRRYPQRNITFRNLGWSGDTVEGISQAGFGSTLDGFKHLVDHVLTLKPTVIILGYGANESFQGAAGLPKFLQDLDKLLKAIEPAKARLVFLSPTRQEDIGPPLPDPTRHNADLALYRDALKAEAQKRKAVFADLFDLLPDGAKATPRWPLTENGLHFSPYGYWKLAEAIERGLKLTPVSGDVEAVLNVKNRKIVVPIDFPTKITDLKEVPDGIQFRLSDEVLPLPIPPGRPPEITRELGWRRDYPDGSALGLYVRITGMVPGLYRLKVDGKSVATFNCDDFDGHYVAYVKRVVEFDQVEALRAAINAKNELYFYRWRPQNETYLFGFRKHEQGQNAREIPQFDPLVAAKEAEIAKLRVPVSHVYELIREGEVAR
jgi:lysophospholipase L1-like esterase